MFAKTVPYYLSKNLEVGLESVRLYWVLYSAILFILVLLNYKREEKSISNLFITSLLIGSLVVDILNYSYQIYDMNYSLSYSWKFRSYLSMSVLFYLFISRNRYHWRNLKSVDYDTNKIQAIYSKPSSVITLLGATTSLSPKCSVRYSYKGKTIRFKIGVKTPILCNTVIDKDDVIEDTDLTVDYFERRWKEIKNKRFNLFTFNCRSLFKK